jgi:hypothetical protein
MGPKRDYWYSLFKMLPGLKWLRDVKEHEQVSHYGYNAFMINKLVKYVYL